MHLTPSWVHVRFTDPYGLFATDSDEHYNSLCDMGSQVLDKGHTALTLQELRVLLCEAILGLWCR